MKSAYLILLLFLFSIDMLAQNDTNNFPPGITIVKKDWYKKFTRPTFDESPFDPIEVVQQSSGNPATFRKENDRRVRRGIPASKTPSSIKPSVQGNTESANIYIYKLKIKNNGDKQIKSLVWDYVFYEIGTSNEVGRIQFKNNINVESGKTKDLAISTNIPPSKTINVKATGEKLRNQYSDRVIIQAIEYSDGSIWKHTEQTANN